MLRLFSALRVGIMLLVVVVLGASSSSALAQNPVQWSGDVRGSVGRAAEQTMPLLFWISQGKDLGDDDDLRDAQSECFRDPAVVEIVHKHFIPVRVSRTSNVIQEAEKLGLPTNHALYCAVMTHDGRLLDQMGPMDVANPKIFTEHLNRAYETFCDDVYAKDLLPIFQDPEATVPKLRLALQTVWRLDIRKADKDAIKVLDRKGLTQTQTSRLYELLAALGTQATIGALLDRTEDKAAAGALGRARPEALEWLLPELPGDGGKGDETKADGEKVTARQMNAYQACAKVCGLMSAKTKEWWEKAKPEERRKEIERVRERAQMMMEFARGGGGGGNGR